MNKKKIALISFICVIVLTTSVSLYFYINKKSNLNNITNYNIGTWWWDDTLELNKYLTFSSQNNVTEIYYCNSDFNEETSNFITNCNQRNIKVYYLDGYYKWLTNDSKREVLYNKLDKYLDYQSKNLSKFAGVHLDIEPHQDPTFNENRQYLIYKLIELMSILKNKYPTIEFNYDIPFWLDDEINFNGTTKQAYKHIIDIAGKVTVMSYRDSSDKIYSVAKDEIEYAQSINKSLNLSVETSNNDEDVVTFYEEGKDFLNVELNNLRQKLPQNYGISIHHIKTWYELS